MRDFDTNSFKKNIKDWVAQNPRADIEAFTDYCEDQIPQRSFASYEWLVDQSVSWFKHVLRNREVHLLGSEEGDET